MSERIVFRGKFDPNNKRIKELSAKVGSLAELCEDDDSYREELFMAEIELFDAAYCDAKKHLGSGRR